MASHVWSAFECLEDIGCICEGDSMYCNECEGDSIFWDDCLAESIFCSNHLADSILSESICHEIQYSRKLYDMWIQIISELWKAVQS